MREKLTENLSCPKLSKGHACRGSIKIRNAEFFKSAPKEIVEGILKCSKCGQIYPILAGIPVIVNGLGDFFRRNYHFIKGACRHYGLLSAQTERALLFEMMAAYKNKKEKLCLPQLKYDAKALSGFDRANSSYFINHHDRLEDIVTPGEPFHDFIQRSFRPTPHEILEAFLERNLKGRSVPRSLDIGCNVGGMSAKLAGVSDHVIGVDLSFYNLLCASSVVKHLPRKMTAYRLLYEPNQFARRSLHCEKKENVDFVLASGTNLPLRNDSVDIALSCNVIDIIDKPRALLEEKIRAAKKGGLILSSDPYQFFTGLKDDPKKKMVPENRIKSLLRKRCRILEEKRDTVWLSRNYKRAYMLYFNHSFCATKV